MKKSYLLIISIVAFLVLLFVLQSFKEYNLSSDLQLFLVPVLTVLYFVFNKVKSLWFSLFLIIYSVSDVVHFLDNDEVSNIFYYICNVLYIIAYLFLLFEVSKALSLKTVFKKFTAQLVVLFLLNCYTVYVMIEIIQPIVFQSNQITAIRVVESLFNIVLLLILSASFVNLLERYTKKAFYLFLGCTALVFSEFILFGYYYLSNENLIDNSATVLYSIGFFFLYYQSDLILDTDT